MYKSRVSGKVWSVHLVAGMQQECSRRHKLQVAGDVCAGPWVSSKREYMCAAVVQSWLVQESKFVPSGLRPLFLP